MGRSTSLVCLVVGCPNLRPCGVDGHERARSAHWSPDRDREAQRKFASAVKRRDRVCQSCGSSSNLEAHHTVGGPNFNDIAYGVTLCSECHKRADSHAR
jgi:hypothetical protein